jgi:hypothetical protein
MSFPSITNTFINGETIDATALNDNFSDLVNAMRDGQSDLRMNDATFLGSIQVDNNLTVSGNLCDASGYVGINVTNPTTHLHCDGSAYISGAIISYPPTGGWADVSGLYAISGLTPTTTYTYNYKRIGTTNHIYYDMSGNLDGTSFVVGLPTRSSDNGVGYGGLFWWNADWGNSYGPVPGRVWCPAGSRDATFSKDYGDGTFSGYHSVRFLGSFTYEE